MKKKLQIVSFFLLIVAGYKASSQTYFWTEDFSTSTCTKGCMLPYTGVNGTWTWSSTGTNGAKANTWYISYEEEGMGRTQCGTSGADPSLHVGNVKGSPLASFFCPGGDCGAAYDAGLGTGAVVTNAMAQSPTINCTGENTITLSFNYIMDGQTSKDYASVWYNTGSGWTLLVNMTKSGNCVSGQGKWKHYTIAMPASANNNATVQIGFNWTNNDDGAGTDPSFAVDSIQLSVPAVLPIQLLSFNARFNSGEGVVNINWETATETNNALFTIERASGDNYIPVVTMKGAGNSSVPINYSAIDPSPPEGTLYYRLKQTDFDGHFTYSNTVAIDIEDTRLMKVYPNPAQSIVNVSWYSASQGITGILYIYDNVGRQLFSMPVTGTYSGLNMQTMDIGKLSAGMYFIKLECPAGKAFYSKFIKQ